MGAKKISPKLLSILIIDDEPALAEILHETLASRYAVRSVHGVEEALSMIAMEVPDFILCDLIMPKQTGKELYEILYTSYPGLQNRMVFMTGGITSQSKADFLKSIPNAVLEKPFGMGSLIQLIDKVDPAPLAMEK